MQICVHVSILVVMDFLFQGLPALTSSGLIYCFNPCCDGFPISSPKPVTTNMIDCCVSILVVMDFLFQDHQKRVVQSSISCFNPCCDGFPISSRDATMIRFGSGRFQSLLWWISYFKREDRFFRQTTWFGFNPCCDGFPISRISLNGRLIVPFTVSILVVMDFLFQGSRGGGVFKKHSACFNPCCDGFPISRSSARRFTHFNMSFNPCCDGFPISRMLSLRLSALPRFVSILVVMDFLFQGAAGQVSGNSYFRFNPCCDGFPISSQVNGLLNNDAVPFQSLLWWISYFKTDTMNTPSLSPSVSILVVMDFLFQAAFQAEKVYAAAGFNPCCDGFPISSDRFRTLRHLTDCVSILVVMDFLFQVWCPKYRRKVLVGFQSLLWWISYFKSLSVSVRFRGGRVSILVVMDFLFQVQAQPLHKVMLQSFNPCCDGFPISRPQ